MFKNLAFFRVYHVFPASYNRSTEGELTSMVMRQKLRPIAKKIGVEVENKVSLEQKGTDTTHVVVVVAAAPLLREVRNSGRKIKRLRRKFYRKLKVANRCGYGISSTWEDYE